MIWLYTDADRNSVQTCATLNDPTRINVKECGRERVWLNVKYDPSIFLGFLTKFTHYIRVLSVVIDIRTQHHPNNKKLYHLIQTDG